MSKFEAAFYTALYALSFVAIMGIVTYIAFIGPNLHPSGK